MVSQVLQSKTYFSSIYGREFIFTVRASPNACRWLPQSEIVLDMLTAGMLTITGDMPYVCAASVSTPEGLGLLRDAGFRIPSVIYRYVDATDYLALISNLCREGREIVTQHVHPVNEIPPVCSWIEPSVLSFVNNKANMGELVPNPYVPHREIVPVNRLVHSDMIGRLPVVVKVSTDESTGGGGDVRICRTLSDVRLAASSFEESGKVVVEEYLPIRQNLCLHYGVTGEGDVSYLGFAEQVSDEEGLYQGNWLDAQCPCPAEAIEAGAAIARAGFERGYFGVLGIDIAVLEDGTCRVFDLNFRGNGSTPAVLYADSILDHCHAPVLRFRRFLGKGNYREMLNAVYRAMARGMLLPLGSCDPEAGSYREERPRLIGLIPGQTREDVLEKERKLTELGLSL